MIPKNQLFCDFCGTEIRADHAYKHKNKTYCSKHCVFKQLDIQFVRLEG